MNLLYAYPSNLDRSFVRSLQVAQTVNSLAKAGINVNFLKGRNYNNINDIEKFNQFGLSIHPNLNIIPISMQRPPKTSLIRISWNFISYYSILLHILRHQAYQSIDVIYTRDLRLAKKLINWRIFYRRSRLVFEIHDLKNLKIQNPTNHYQTNLNKDEDFIINHADAIVSISPGLTDFLEKWFYGLKILTAPSGVDQEVFKPVKFNPGNKTITYIGSLYEWKGVDLAVRAMKYLDQDIRLKIIGAKQNDSNAKRLQQLITNMKLNQQVEILNFMPQDSLHSILKKSAALVLPLPPDQLISSHFTSPLKLFEYMSTGLPIIASDVPSLNWILNHLENSYLFNPDDPKQLAKGIEEILSNVHLSKNISQKALEDVQNYTWDKRGEKIAEYLTKVFQ
jgi:glycosyltransferase involved in cell wall biosynthesis